MVLINKNNVLWELFRIFANAISTDDNEEVYIWSDSRSWHRTDGDVLL